MRAAPPRESGRKPAKASDSVADELRERILAGEFGEGTPLPPERELVTRYSVSRTTVREALRVLEVQGFVRIKTGRTGGAYVCMPDSESLESSVSLLIRGQHIRLGDILETRVAIEPQCARLAAKYRTDSDLAALDAADKAMSNADTVEQFLVANVDWHIAVAVATHNELLSGLMLALARAILASTETKGMVDDAARARTISAHAGVSGAIHEGDQAAAQHRMAGHVETFLERALELQDRAEIAIE